MTDEQRRESGTGTRVEQAERDERARPAETTEEQARTDQQQEQQGDLCCPVEIVEDRGTRDTDFQRAQRDAGGDYTSEATGGFPVGERAPLSDNMPDDLPGDEVDDIPTSDRNHPGTVDDVPYSMDQDRPGYRPPLEPKATGNEERDLWRQQEPLINEDREQSLHLEGFPDSEIPDILDALGDDAAEDSQGETVEARIGMRGPDHNGFPARPGDAEPGAVGSAEAEEEARKNAQAPTEGGPENRREDRDDG